MALSLPLLTTLARTLLPSLCGNTIRQAGAAAIGQMLRHNTTLRKLKYAVSKRAKERPLSVPRRNPVYALSPL